MLGLMMGVATVIMMVLPGGVMVGLAMGQIGVAEDPTTSGSSHLLTGVLLGVSEPDEIRNRLNCRCFPHDFGSVPGSQDLRNFQMTPTAFPGSSAPNSNRRQTTSRFDDAAQRQRSPFRATPSARERRGA
jgi:hypothetical protein